MDLENRLREYYAAWSRQDADGVLGFFDRDATFEDLAFAAKLEGLDQIRSFVELTYAGAPDFEVRPMQIVVSRLQAAAAWVMSGTHRGDLPGLPSTQQRFEVRAASMVMFGKDGQIQSMVDYWNPLEFRAAVGLA